VAGCPFWGGRGWWNGGTLWNSGGMSEGTRNINRIMVDVALKLRSHAQSHWSIWTVGSAIRNIDTEIKL
jgi:hypothetical protein